MKKALLLCIATTLWLYAMPSQIQAYLNKSRLPASDVSIYIKELGTNRVIASHYADKTRKPASVVKVMTNYAALLELGFEYQWETHFYTKSRLFGGRLDGDLFIKGHGDPTLDIEDVEQIAKKIYDKGIREIRGDIVIDRSFFKVGNKDSANFDKYPHSPYNALPDAMMFNERTSTVCIDPRKKTVQKEFSDLSYKVENQIKFVNRSCRGKYAWANAIVDTKQKSPRIILKGNLSKHCGERNVCKVVTKPYKALYYALKEALSKEGVVLKGYLRLESIPEYAKLFFIHYSEPLEEVISKAAKESNNLYARHLMLQVGVNRYGAPATVKKGRDATMELLKSYGGLSRGTIYLDNGSGLSRRSKLSAKMLANVYEHAYERYGKRWVETLSIAGVDGTIKKRFKRKPAYGKAWMKTGTLRGVKNIGGYVQNRAGTYYTVVILVNTKKSRSRAEKLQNNIINWLSQTTRSPSKYNKPITKASEKVKRKQVKKRGQNSIATAKNSYYIQVASALKKPNNAYLGRIEKAGFDYTVEYKDRYRILIGSFSTKEDAKGELKRVRRNLSKDAFIVKR